MKGEQGKVRRAVAAGPRQLDDVDTTHHGYGLVVKQILVGDPWGGPWARFGAEG